MPEITLTVSRRHDGKRLDQAVLALLSDAEPKPERLPSRSEIQRAIEGGKAFVNGKTETSPKNRVFFGDTLRLDLGVAGPRKTPSPRLPLKVLRRTSHFLAVAKPAGLSTHSPHIRSSAPALLDAVLERYPELQAVGDPARPALLHRLDRDTSGILLFARTEKGYEELKKAFESRKVRKSYLALVWGEIKEERLIQASLRRAKGTIRQRLARGEEASREAETLVSPLISFPEAGATLVLAQPKTGRTHQIRVHLASIGHPVLGDSLYGSKLSKKSPLPASRQLLHAWRLRFRVADKPFELEAPLPSDFQEALFAAAPARFRTPEALESVLAGAREKESRTPKG